MDRAEIDITHDFYLKKFHLVKDKLAEEINLLYVAVTRTRNILNIPEELMPRSRVNVIPKRDERDFVHTGMVENMPCEKVFRKFGQMDSSSGNVPKNTGKLWSIEEDDQLTVLYCEHTQKKRPLPTGLDAPRPPSVHGLKSWS
ncbi:MAG: hypothetical protein JXA23_09475 [Bacteroidales bacterium]|nr:hypothetical protein [Bacteroidales bacterium]